MKHDDSTRVCPPNHLPQSFYVVPGHSSTMTQAELRETLLATDG